MAAGFLSESVPEGNGDTFYIKKKKTKNTLTSSNKFQKQRQNTQGHFQKNKAETMHC